MSNKFNGERLRQARLYRKCTINELAEALGVSKQAISQYETQNQTPEFTKMRLITEILKFPSSYFFQQDSHNVEETTTYFRALLSTNKSDRLQQNIKIRHLAIIHEILCKYIEYPKLNLPKIPRELKENLTSENIEIIAMLVREHWNLGVKPINDIIHLLEKNGIVTTAYPIEKQIDAYSKMIKINNNERFIIVLSTDKDSAVRINFDAAHELGHILLHDWCIDLEELSKEEFKQREKEANNFAAAFLLPRQSFTREVAIFPKNLNYYVELKRKWKVSIPAMIIRAFNLDIITDNQYQYLMKQLSFRKWRNSEPLDDILIKSEPTLLKRSIDMLLDNNIFDVRTFLDELQTNNLSMEAEEVENLLNLEKGKLSNFEQCYSPVSIELKIKK